MSFPRLALATLACLGLAAPLAAQTDPAYVFDPAGDPLVQLLDLIRAQDCQLTRDQGQALGDASTAAFSPEVLEPARAALEALIPTGDLILDPATDIMRMSEGLCAGEPLRLEAIAAALTAELEANGCTMDPAAASAALAMQGYEDAAVEATGDYLARIGLLSEDAGGALVLADCAAPDDRMAAAQAALAAAAMANDCTIGFEAALSQLGAQGFAPDEIENAGEAMIDAGLADNQPGDVLILSPDSCTPAAVVVPDAADPVTAFLMLMRDHGCSGNRDWVQALEPVLRDHFGAAAMAASEQRIDAMFSLGDMTDDSAAETISLSDEVCAGGPGRLAALQAAIAALAAADCTVGFESTVTALAPQGFSAEEVETAGALMVDEGQAQDLGGDSLRLAAPLCTAAAPDAPPVAEGPDVDSAAFVVDGALRGNGCGIRVKDLATLDRVLLPPLAAALGITPGDPATDRALRDLGLQGIGVLVASGRVALMPGTGEARLLACP